MPLQQQHITELQNIYLQEFGRELSDDEAWAMAHQLINLYKMLIRREQEQVRKAQLP